MARPSSTDARCLDCNYPLRELTTDRCPECGRSFDAGNPATYHHRCLYRLALKYWAKPPSLWTIVPYVLLLIAMVYLVSCSGGTHGPYRVVHEARVFPLVTMVVVCDLLIRGLAAIRNWEHSRANAILRCRRGRWRWFAIPVSAMLFASLHVYNWPLKLRFEMSRSAFEDEIDRLKTSSPTRWRSKWIGFYEINSMEYTNDTWDYDSTSTANVWLYTGWWTFSGMTLHYDHGISVLYRERSGPPPEDDPGGGIYHPEIADPPWYVYY